MATTCPKCQTVNAAATGAPNETCPQCGVIYTRTVVVQAQRRVADSTRASVPAKPTGAPGALERLCWWVVVVGCAIAIVHLGITIDAETAPQQAAGAGLALGFAAVPYCLARAIQHLSR